MDAHTARTRLIAQHDQLRGHLNHCRVLARRMLEGEAVHTELDEALAQLRHAFMQHNTTEVDLIGPLLQNSQEWGGQLVDRMLEEHLAEHTAFWEMLAGAVTDVASRMDDLVDELDAHMAAEERTFLSPLVLHEDVIQRHRRQEPT
jgi:hypothetical protein